MIHLGFAVVALVFGAGYVTQRGNVCAVTAVAELVWQQRSQQFVGFVLCSACSLLAISLAELRGYEVIVQQPGLPATLTAALGGAIYGAGAFINGRCAFGTVDRLGRGDLSRLATLASFFIGAMLAPALLTMSVPVASPLLLLGADTRLVAALVLVAALIWWVRDAKPDASQAGGWAPVYVMPTLGMLIGILIALGRNWTYTPLLLEANLGSAPNLIRHAGLAAVFLGGAIWGAVRAGLFLVNSGTIVDWVRAAGGGAIMGAGARLVPGGNDAMLFVGLPLLLPNLILAYATMNAALVLLTSAAKIAGRQHGRA